MSKKMWKPRGAMVIVKYLPKDEARLAGSIVLPTDALDSETCECEIVAFGAGLPGDLPTTDLRIGQRALVRYRTSPGFTQTKGGATFRENGTPITQNGEQLFAINNREIWALLD